MKNNLKKLMFPILCIVMVISSIFGISKIESISNPSQKTQVYSEIIQYFKNKDVKEYKLNIASGEMTVVLKDGKKINYNTPSPKWVREDIKDYIKEYNEENPSDNMKQEIISSPRIWSVIACAFFYLLPILGVVALLLCLKFMPNILDGAKSMPDFGRTKFKDMSQNGTQTKFEDVAGADEEKEELQELVSFLKDPQKYYMLGAKIPKGVLLVGPPGTGKTLLARAVAGEANVPFLSISGSDFVELFVGMGASRVRSLFSQAKKNAPCIIFIDEIDAVGRQRGPSGYGSGGHDEREQTLNQLLVEMDGFGENEGVIIIAATNRPEILDKALLRPGRFDRQVVVNYPDVKGREEILKIHSKGKPIAPDVDLKTVAKSTQGFTGAELANLLNEAAIFTARENLKAITMEQINKATIKVVVGGAEKKSKVISDKEKKLTAYHECGHAIVTYFCKTAGPVHEISIIPAGLAGGYTLSLPAEERSYWSYNEMIEEIMTMLGGRAAEIIVTGDMATGASNDIEKATKIAYAMVKNYGMSTKLGPISYSSDNEAELLGKAYSERIASEIDEEVRKIIAECYERSKEIIKTNLDALNRVADYLIENEKIDGETFKNLVENKIVTETDKSEIK